MSQPGRPLTEAVMFFSQWGICKQMLFPEFEALLDGMVSTPEFADETMDAVFLQISSRLHVRGAVFFTIDFDQEGMISSLWNLPLRLMADKAGRGPDMGGGPIRLACAGFTRHPQYKAHLWKPGQRGGRSDLLHIKDAVTRNSLGILGEDDNAVAMLAAGQLHMAAEDAWFGDQEERATESSSEELLATERDRHSREADELRQKINALQTELQIVQQARENDIEMLRQSHREHLDVLQGEMLDIKQSLEEQQQHNLNLKRELSKLQQKHPVDPG
ncbi:hypothetical protein [Halopseudomonas salegens]|uniref:Uncharacterized protein n=1 Tax=Halopseudomonas salegens TaxID=1434072 RepID=A0A1H2F1A9_9GAMM|nr:hypothetical protein [Halopseudomonas salegens]SDU01105.1 hypothetical protein SAMN05216210_1207 [Halopseudomonas salegens]